MIIATFKPGVPMVYAHGLAKKLGCQLKGKVINGRFRLVMERTKW